jgi:hypothetical protein
LIPEFLLIFPSESGKFLNAALKEFEEEGIGLKNKRGLNCFGGQRKLQMNRCFLQLSF